MANPPPRDPLLAQYLADHNPQPRGRRRDDVTEALLGIALLAIAIAVCALAA